MLTLVSTVYSGEIIEQLLESRVRSHPELRLKGASQSHDITVGKLGIQVIHKVSLTTAQTTVYKYKMSRILEGILTDLL